VTTTELPHSVAGAILGERELSACAMTIQVATITTSITIAAIQT